LYFGFSACNFEPNYDIDGFYKTDLQYHKSDYHVDFTLHMYISFYSYDARSHIVLKCLVLPRLLFSFTLCLCAYALHALWILLNLHEGQIRTLQDGLLVDTLLLASYSLIHRTKLLHGTPSATALLRLDYASKSRDRVGYKSQSTTTIFLIPTNSPKGALFLEIVTVKLHLGCAGLAFSRRVRVTRKQSYKVVRVRLLAEE
jgi:hypothetical protein